MGRKLDASAKNTPKQEVEEKTAGIWGRKREMMEEKWKRNDGK
jgi:hypothetical protein